MYSFVIRNVWTEPSRPKISFHHLVSRLLLLRQRWEVSSS